MISNLLYIMVAQFQEEIEEHIRICNSNIENIRIQYKRTINLPRKLKKRIRKKLIQDLQFWKSMLTYEQPFTYKQFLK